METVEHRADNCMSLKVKRKTFFLWSWDNGCTYNDIAHAVESFRYVLIDMGFPVGLPMPVERSVKDLLVALDRLGEFFPDLLPKPQRFFDFNVGEP